MTEYSLTDTLAIPGESAAGEVVALFDPSQRESYDRLFSLFLTLSLSAHFLLIAALWTLPDEEKKEEITIVEMIEAPKPMEAPEAAAAPKKLQRKVIAQRLLDASTTRFNNVAQQAVKSLAEVPSISQAQPVDSQAVAMANTERVQVGPVVRPGAPRELENKAFETKALDEFAVNVKPAQQLDAPAMAPRAVMVNSSRQSAGPKITEAAGPIVSNSPTIAAPNVAIGVLSDNAVSGDPEGAAVFALESGNDDGTRNGVDGGVAGGVAGGLVGGKVGGVPGGMLGGRGTGAGGSPAKDCMKERDCLEYLEMIRRRVYARWNNAGREGGGGKVELRFRIDRGGSAHGAKIVRSDDQQLGETCVLAFNQANPFPPPPESINYIINKTIRATFTVGE